MRNIQIIRNSSLILNNRFPKNKRICVINKILCYIISSFVNPFSWNMFYKACHIFNICVSHFNTIWFVSFSDCCNHNA